MASNQHPLPQPCSICLNCFDFHNHCPRILPCGHSFCSGCLKSLRLSRESDADTCPKCRHTFTIAEVELLPKNFALLDIMPLQLTENESSPICKEIVALAIKAKSHVEKIIVAERRVLMVLFRIMNERENLTSLIGSLFKQFGAALTSREQFLMNELGQFFENTVNKSPGFQGLPLSNFAFLSIKNGSDHKCLQLQAEAVSKCRRDVMEAVATNTSTDAAAAQVTGAVQDLKKSCDEVACKTQDLFIKLRDELTALKEVLVDDINKLYLSKNDILLKQLEDLYILQTRLESTIQFVSSDMQSLSDAALLDIVDKIKVMLEAMESENIVLEPQADCVLEVTLDVRLFLWKLENLEGGELLCDIEKTGFISDRSTCARTTTAAGFGLQCAPLGSQASFTITAYDAQGCQRGLGSDVFVIELKENTGERKVEVNLEDKGDGTYLATYTVPADAESGNYMLSVLLRGAHIKDSPFVVLVGHPC